MTELADRMTRLADAAIGDRQLADPSIAGAGSSRRRPPWPWLGAAAGVLVLVAVAAVVVGSQSDDDPVTAGPSTGAIDTPAPPSADPVLSVAFAADLGGPLGLDLIVRDGAGEAVAERTSAEVEEPYDDGSGGVHVGSGLIVELPGEGEYTVDLVGAGVELTCGVGAAAPGDRLILAVAVEDGGPSCGGVETVEDWARDSSDLGLQYLGLTEAEAGERIEADGYRSRVVGRDGVGLAITMDLARDRFDLMVFDGVVVAANGAGSRVPGEARVTEPLAVVFVSPTGRMTGRGEVLVVVDDEGVQRDWGPVGEGESGTSVLIDDLPAGVGTLELQGQMCTMDLDVGDEGTVVTIEVASDGTVDGPDCPATVETLADHVARITEGWEAYDPADAYVGLTAAEAETRAENDGLDVRVLARDGLPFGQDDDLRDDRVNLVVYDDEVRAASVF